MDYFLLNICDFVHEFSSFFSVQLHYNSLDSFSIMISIFIPVNAKFKLQDHERIASTHFEAGGAAHDHLDVVIVIDQMFVTARVEYELHHYLLELLSSSIDATC